MRFTNGVVRAFFSLIFIFLTLSTFANNPPVSIGLSGNTSEEGQAVGSFVATMTTTDMDILVSGDTHTYTMGPTGPDNASFQISGDQLLTNAVFTYPQTLFIDITTTDGAGASLTLPFNIQVTPIVNAPGSPMATVISETQIDLNWTDSNTGLTQYQIERSETSGSGFSVIFTEALGSSSFSDGTLTLGTTYYYRIRALRDGAFFSSYSAEFSATTLGGNAAPTDITLDNNSILEFEESGTVVGNLSTTDADAGDTHTYSLFDNASFPDNVYFSISGNELQSADEFDVTVQPTYTINIQTQDAAGDTFVKSFIINIDPYLPDPTSLTVSVLSDTEIEMFWSDNSPNSVEFLVERSLNPGFGFSVIKNLSPGITYYLDQGLTPGTTYYYRIQAERAGVGSGYSTVESGTTSGGSGNSAPSDIALDNTSILEFQTIGSSIGNLSTSDPDAGDTHTYSLFDNASFPDNASFTISGDQLLSAEEFDVTVQPTYTINIQTEDAAGDTFVKSFIITIDPLLVDPTNLVATTISDTEIDLTWDDNSNNKSEYLVERSTIPGSGFVVIKNLAAGTDSYLDNGLTPGTTYYYRIQGERAGVNSGYSNVASATTTGSVNNAPTDIALDNSSITELQATGTLVGNLSTIDADAGDTHTYTFFDDASFPDNTSFTISGNQLLSNEVFDVTVKTTYNINIQTQDVAGDSFVKSFSITIDPLLVDPTNLVATAISDTEIDLTWDDNTPGTAEYIVERSTTPGTGFSVVQNLVAGTTSFTDNGLTPATTYYYRVQAERTGVGSGYSNEASATTIGPAAVFTWSGNLTTPTGKPVKDSEVALYDGSTLDSIVVTDVNGQFSFNVTENKTYKVIPTKLSDTKPNNGVSTFDLIKIQRHLLSITSFTNPYHIIASDADVSGSLSVTDITSLKRLVLGKETFLPGGSNWTFVDASATIDIGDPFNFPDSVENVATSDDNSVDFVALKLGDINYNWNSNLRTTFDSEMDMFFGDPQEQNGLVTIPVYSSGIRHLGGYQFTIEWNSDGFLDVKNGALNHEFNVDQVGSHMLSGLWFTENTDGQALFPNDLLFELVFDAVTFDATSITFTNTLTETSGFKSTLEPIKINGEAKELELSGEPFQLLQNYPNPFEETTTIAFTYQESTEGTLEITDLNGRMLHNESVEVHSGLNKLDLDNMQFERGIYLYTLSIGEHKQTRRLIKR